MEYSTSLSQGPFWIIVADEACAIFYSREKKFSPLEEMFRLENEAARQKMSDLITDRGGRSYDSGGQGRHRVGKEDSDPKTQSAIAFAREIASRLASARHGGKFESFALVAAPRFLGVLRDAISRAGNPTPYLTIDKELVGKDPAFIGSQLDNA